jgi:hypothetical protein
VLAATAALAIAREIAIRLRNEPLGAPHSHGIKGDVRRGSDGKLWYFNGERWSTTPPRPDDVPF